MSTVSQLNQELNIDKALLTITESLGEVAAIKFKATHSQIEHNTYFFSEIAQVYKAIELVAAKKNMLKRKKQLPNNSVQTVSVMLTSNYQFNGDLDHQLVNYYLKNVPLYPTDRIVVGKVGAEIIESVYPQFTFQSFVFKSDQPSIDELNTLVAKIRPFKKILIYHSKYVTILDQKVDVSELSSAEPGVEAIAQSIDYLVEPELEKMLEFFENQIMASRLYALFLEAQLSRTATRMVGMDQAELNAEKVVKKEKFMMIKEKNKLQNLRILETYTSIRRGGK